jgi:hypothetical protein
VMKWLQYPKYESCHWIKLVKDKIEYKFNAWTAPGLPAKPANSAADDYQ